MKTTRSSTATASRSHSGSFPLSVILCFLLVTLEESYSLTQPSLRRLFSFQTAQTSSTHLCMVSLPLPDKDNTGWASAKSLSLDRFQQQDTTKRRVRKKYQRKRIPETERERYRLLRERQAKYEQIVQNADGECPNVWSFESLFPKPVWDKKTIDRDLYESKRRDASLVRDRQSPKTTKQKLKTSSIGASSMMRVWREPKLSSFILPYVGDVPEFETMRKESIEDGLTDEEAVANIFQPTNNNTSIAERLAAIGTNSSGMVDLELSRLVEDKMFGYRRGTGLYETSLLGEGAVKFREGVRLGNPLSVNAARLNYHAKKELRNNRVEEAQELYEKAIQIDPRDGRAYLGLSKCAERRRDFKLAREFLIMGVANSVSCAPDGKADNGANPFLLQALGCLEEKKGHLAEAEALYIEAAKSRPSHAASWVALAQLRTRKFRQSAAAGRVCYQAAERELKITGEPPSAHVYTAWASMEYKKAGDYRRSRQLYKMALDVDPRCSAAWLQLGVMEADNENWEDAELCFETVLKFDQRNSRVLQAFAIMESKRPESNSRKVIGLFERGLQVNSRDAGVLQPYALYVAKLGDIDSARDLLRRGTEVNKRHAPVWQAWGVLETREGNAEEARNVFQQGIWACAQLAGGQSGGYNCARLWQAWGVLEAQEGDYPAARRCFSRALDADKRNIAAMTAWTMMEEGIDNLTDARLLFERAVKQFAPGTDEKKRLWSAYELMEQRAGNINGAQEIYRRAMRESFNTVDVKDETTEISSTVAAKTEENYKEKEIEVSRWADLGSSSMSADEVWMNDGSIEGKVPKAAMQKSKQRRQKQ